ncbi:MAG TPA: cupin domain-containing protein [Gaiellaceae bacterium]
MKEAKLHETPYGRNPAEEGWFVLNLGDALAVRNEEKGGATYPLEPEGGPFTGFGVNVQVLWPGEPNGLYHSENMREAFLVLSGECTLLVEEQERPLRQWDFVHCPEGTNHIFVGAGEGPCSILMIGARAKDATLHYPVSELAARHAASVGEATPNPEEAYADWPGDFVPVRLPWPVE